MPGKSYSNGRIYSLSSAVHHALASLPEDIATQFTTASASQDVKGDATSMLWEGLKRLLFATVMSLQGFVTTVIYSPYLRNGGLPA